MVQGRFRDGSGFRIFLNSFKCFLPSSSQELCSACFICIPLPMDRENKTINFRLLAWLPSFRGALEIGPWLNHSKLIISCLEFWNTPIQAQGAEHKLVFTVFTSIV